MYCIIITKHSTLCFAVVLRNRDCLEYIEMGCTSLENNISADANEFLNVSDHLIVSLFSRHCFIPHGMIEHVLKYNVRRKFGKLFRELLEKHSCGLLCRASQARRDKLRKTVLET